MNEDLAAGELFAYPLNTDLALRPAADDDPKVASQSSTGCIM
jgi:hypothetical protein